MGGDIVDLSDNGRVVTGGVMDVAQVHWWRRDLGLRTLSLIGTERLFENNALSADGAIVVGDSFDASRVPYPLRVFRWDAVSREVTLLLPGPANAIPGETNGTVVPNTRPAVSADGNTIVGIGEAYDDQDALVHGIWAFRWTSSGGTSDVPQEAFGELFTPVNIAGDGGVITGVVGDDLSSPDQREAAIWTPNGGSGIGTELGIPDQGAATGSLASMSSYDGSIIGGFRIDPSGVPAGSGFLWTSSGGASLTAMLTRPHSITEDGKIVTFLQKIGTVRHPWVEIDEIFVDNKLRGYLPAYFGLALADLPYGDQNRDPYGLVSADGGVFSMTGATWVANVRPINYVALGDSYSSGEGVPIFDSETASEDNDCHRSENAYSTRIRPRSSSLSLKTLGSQNQDYSWHSLACSGATTLNVSATATGAGGQHPGTIDASPQLFQVDANIDRFVDANTDLVTITIGGNDGGFATLIEDCVTNSFDCRTSDAPETDTPWNVYLPQQITGEIRQSLKDLFEEIRVAAPNATIVALGYPQLVTGVTCADLGLPEFPFLTISTNEQIFLRQMAERLNTVQMQEATAAGVHFIDMRDKFFGHEVCEDDPLIHGVDTDVPVFTLHPNREGHAMYASALNEFLTGRGIKYAPGFFESGLPKNPAPQQP